MLGTHQVWAGIVPHPDDQALDDNYAYTLVAFEPYWLHLPVISRR